MRRPNPVILLAVTATIGIAMAGLTLSMGGLYVDVYDGDSLHLVDLVMRMAAGQRPHLDFVTPIGDLAILPLALFVEAGTGIGHAFVYAQILVAAVLLVPAVWIGWSRFPGYWGILFAAAIMVLSLALVHGQAETAFSASMHYNRWAWALGFLAVGTAFLPPRGERPRHGIDGAVLGAAMTALGLIKVTYVLAFAPPIVVMLLLRGAWRTLAVALAVTALACLTLTAWLGPDYWGAYLGDLTAVSGSEIRSYPTYPLSTVLGGPAFLPGTLLGFAAVVLLRQGNADRAPYGLGLLLLLPGFFFVTYQNFGNDPQWVLLLGLLLIPLAPWSAEEDPTGALRMAGAAIIAALFALAAPSYLNMATSPLTLMTRDTTWVPIFPRNPPHDDFYSSEPQALRYNVVTPGPGVSDVADLGDRDAPAMVNGAALPDCALTSGLTLYLRSMARDLGSRGYGGPGAEVVVADLLSALWLFDGRILPVRGAAPWSYGGTPGWAQARYLVVPLCPLSPETRVAWLTALDDRGERLREVTRTALYIVFERASERGGEDEVEK
ncbi:hypothetical protein EKE94_06220 [Mesobaculum littorinae]|uniref:DUF2029 domain-containing protein n=1 Tax=Mesobaculum littorinae TaxID=2486419 RepID=A0A438AIJ1_9RHOB|nr:hypothetical protein [Mesobaculum littorinae]RVV98510.1 hypothetical protein EKE94_06220 [Mesobaculum littorinae]